MRFSKPRQSSMVAIVVVALCAAWPSLAQAQCKDQNLPTVDSWKAELAFQQLVRLEALDCLGGPPDPTPVNVRVRETLKFDRDDTDAYRPAAAAGLTLVIDHVTSLNAPPKEVWAELLHQLRQAQFRLGSGQSPALPAAWVLDQGRLPVLTLHLQTSLTEACSQPDAPCSEQFVLVREVLRAARLARTALDVSEAPLVSEFLAETAKREQMWNAYFTEARSQYLWELLLNGRRMKDTRLLENGVRRGFRDVPSDQVLLLHPSVAFEYADSEPRGNRFDGVAVIDVLGYNKWRWKADGTMGFAWGGSLVLTVGDHVERSAVGYGVMLHLNHRWSVGATAESGKVAFIVSGDVAQLWTKVSALRRDRMMTGQEATTTTLPTPQK